MTDLERFSVQQLKSNNKRKDEKHKIPLNNTENKTKKPDKIYQQQQP
jgi:hypothetical protein